MKRYYVDIVCMQRQISVPTGSHMYVFLLQLYNMQTVTHP
jgi:hypothetical protein